MENVRDHWHDKAKKATQNYLSVKGYEKLLTCISLFGGKKNFACTPSGLKNIFFPNLRQCRGLWQRNNPKTWIIISLPEHQHAVMPPPSDKMLLFCFFVSVFVFLTLVELAWAICEDTHLNMSPFLYCLSSRRCKCSQSSYYWASTLSLLPYKNFLLLVLLLPAMFTT